MSGALWAPSARYHICPPGGSSPVGTLGYVLGAFELASQIQGGEIPTPAKVFVPLGTGGTAVGLAIGFALASIPSEVVAVRVVQRSVLPNAWVHLLCYRTVRLIRKAIPRLPAKLSVNLIIEERFSGRYAYPTNDALKAATIAEHAGLEVETTYTAKTLAALLAYSRTRNRGGAALFWQTFAGIDTAAAKPETGQELDRVAHQI